MKIQKVDAQSDLLSSALASMARAGNLKAKAAMEDELESFQEKSEQSFNSLGWTLISEDREPSFAPGGFDSSSGYHDPEGGPKTGDHIVMKGKLSGTLLIYPQVMAIRNDQSPIDYFKSYLYDELPKSISGVPEAIDREATEANIVAFEPIGENKYHVDVDMTIVGTNP
jgi:hypothetical protein